MTVLIPKVVFVPFEWDGKKWNKVDDLPRFKEPEEVAQYIMANNHVCFRDHKPRTGLRWVECNDTSLIKEFLRGVGTKEIVQ